VVLTVACGLPPNKYFLDAEREVNGVIPCHEKMDDEFEVNRGAERGCTQKEVTNPIDVCSIV
jgi:hypothetical protein